MNVMDVNDSILMGQAKTREWQKEFMQTWYEPIIRIVNEAALIGVRNSPMIDRQKLENNLSPDAKARLRG